MTTPFPKEDIVVVHPELGRTNVFNVEGTWFYVTIDARGVPTAAAQKLSTTLWKECQHAAPPVEP